MSETVCVPQSIVPVRHRMSFQDRLKDNLLRLHNVIKPAESKHRRQGRLSLRLGASVLSAAVLSGVVAQEAAVKPERAPAVITDVQQEALATKRYDKCAIQEIETTPLRGGDYRIGVKWILDPNVEVNTLVQGYEYASNVVFGAPRPVIRPFGVIGNEVVTGEPVGRSVMGTAKKPKDISAFSAVLPKPHGNTRLLLSVSNKVGTMHPDGSATIVSAEQPCAELVFGPNPDTGRFEWLGQQLSPTLAINNHYTVNNYPADAQ